MKNNILRAAVVFGSALAIGYACGPNLTSAFISASRAILKAPDHLVGHDFKRLKAAPPVPGKLLAAAKNTETWRDKLPSTLDVDVSDFRRVLKSHGVEEARAKDLIDDYELLRLGQLYRWEDAEKRQLSEQQLAHARQTKIDTHPWIASKSWPEEIPVEFRLYAEGVEKLHHGDISAARKDWQELLDLPLENRRARSTWAAWMLMKTTLESRVPEALGKVIHAALDESCEDSLRTLPAALGLLAESRNSAPSLEALSVHYYNVKANERARYVQALDEAAWRIGLAQDKALRMEAARNPFARAIVATELAGGGGDDKQLENLKQWMKDLEVAGVTGDPAMADLAVLLYQKGEYDLSRRAIARSKRTWASRWIAGKLALQRGAVNEAAVCYADALRLMPSDERSRIVSVTETENYSHIGDESPDSESVRNSIFLAECGTVRLSKSDFEGAIMLFLDAKCPHDAAYVAEQLMSCDELLNFINKHGLELKPEVINPDEDSPGRWEAWHDSWTEDQTNRILYVIARKLGRENYFTRARAFYPPAILPYFDRYVALRRLSANKRVDTNVRATALMEAARYHRWFGMELFGAEGEPDASVWNGYYPAEQLPQGRMALGKRLDYGWDEDANGKLLYNVFGVKKPMQPLPLLSSSDEVYRLRKNQLFGKPRFHYRFVAAQMARQAAHMLPSDSNEAAMMLAEGGTWLPAEEDGVDPFFEELISRFKDTPFAREADQRRWYPDKFREEIRRWNAKEALTRPLPGQ